MPVLNRIAEFASDMSAWRRHLHKHPELGFDCHQTAAFVAERLRAFGLTEIHEGIATSGIVAVIDSGRPGPTIGLRADMDALPISEATGADHASTVPGRMHACGHDGHTAMLLGAARYLAETRNFSGRVALIFQPAEELGGGAGVMVREGVLDRFAISQVYALHNAPTLPVGHFHTNPGGIMASVDDFKIVVRGRGGHAAMPELANDPMMPALAMAQALQTVVSRNIRAGDGLVISITTISASAASNVISETVHMGGTVRTLSPELRTLAERRIREIVAGQAAAFGVEVDLDYARDYPATVNSAAEAAFACDVAREVAGNGAVEPAARPVMGSEDFAYMLEARPGAYLFLGQGEGPMCHHPAFDFNDEISPIGASFFARLVERAQPAEAD